MNITNESHQITSVADAINKLDSAEFREFQTSEVPDYRIGTEYKYPFGIWFRGLPDAEWTLMPGIFRQSEDEYIEETSMFHHFQLRVSEQRHTYQSTFDWLCLMQHYDLPTRLLDWTESVLIALFFAVNDTQSTNLNGKLCVLNARRLNKHTTHSSRQYQANICTPTAFDALVRAQLASSRNLKRFLGALPKLFAATERSSSEAKKIINAVTNMGPKTRKWLACPVAVFPSRLNARMILQSSMFTIHGGKWHRASPKTKDIPRPLSLERIDEGLPKNEQFLKTYVVPGECKHKIREELMILGIHSGSLFPEIDKQAAYVKEQWRFDLPTTHRHQEV